MYYTHCLSLFVDNTNPKKYKKGLRGSNLATICSPFSPPERCRPVTTTLPNLCTSWPSLAVITWNRTTLFHSCRYGLQRAKGPGRSEWQKMHWLGWRRLDLILACPSEGCFFMWWSKSGRSQYTSNAQDKGGFFPKKFTQRTHSRIHP